MKSHGLFALRLIAWACLAAGLAALLVNTLDGAMIGVAYGASGLASWAVMLTFADFVDAATARLEAIDKSTKRAADALDILSRG